MKTRLKVSSAKWRPFCLGLNVLRPCYLYNVDTYTGDEVDLDRNGVLSGVRRWKHGFALRIHMNTSPRCLLICFVVIKIDWYIPFCIDRSPRFLSTCHLLLHSKLMDASILYIDTCLRFLLICLIFIQTGWYTQICGIVSYRVPSLLRMSIHNCKLICANIANAKCPSHPGWLLRKWWVSTYTWIRLLLYGDMGNSSQIISE